MVVDNLNSFDKNMLIALFLIIVAGGFWKGSIIYLISLGAIWVYWSIPSMIITLWGFLTNQLQAIFTDYRIMENAHIGLMILLTPLYSLYVMLWWMIGFAWLPQSLIFFFAIIMFVSFLSVKYLILFVPIISFSIFNKIFSQQFFKIKGDFVSNKVIALCCIILACFVMLSIVMDLSNFNPNQKDWNAVESAISLAELNDLNLIRNDWNLGHWILFASKGKVLPSASSGTIVTVLVPPFFSFPSALCVYCS